MKNWVRCMTGNGWSYSSSYEKKNNDKDLKKAKVIDLLKRNKL